MQTGALSLSIQVDRDLSPSFVYNCLTANVASVVDRKLLETKEIGGDMGHAWLRTQYAGSGPLKILQWRPNELVAMGRNDHHHRIKAPMARMIVRHVKESTTQRLLLQKGDIDIARNLSPQDLDAVKANGDLKMASARRGEVIYLGMNQKNTHLAKPEVREALKWLVDYDTIGQTIVRNTAVVHQNFLPAGVLGSTGERPFRLDVARARGLLAQAGLSQGFKLTIDMRTVQPYQAITEALQQSLRQVGIMLEVLPGDGKQTLTRYRARQHDLYLGSWGMDYWDPHTNADAFARNVDNVEASGQALALKWWAQQARGGGRLLATLGLTYLGLLAVTFFIGRVIPVDPVLAVVGDRAPEHVVQRVRQELGLDQPLWVQFITYVAKVVQGDFGVSVLTSNAVLKDLLNSFPATLELATAGIVVGVGMGIPLGVVAATSRGRWPIMLRGWWDCLGTRCLSSGWA